MAFSYQAEKLKYLVREQKEKHLIISLQFFAVDVVDAVIRTMEELKHEYAAGRAEPGISHVAMCLRCAYCAITKGKAITDAMLHGTELHHWFARHAPQVFARHGCRCEGEVRVSLGQLSGVADMLCDCGGVRAVIELKFTKTPDATNPFFRWHERQLKYYTAIAGADIGVLLMVSFDLQRYSVFHVVLGEESGRALIREALARHEDLARALANNMLPEPERGPWCNYCAFRRECLNERLA
jgi:CRISPR/Cas system-associated exonuclease Cas4 (RecB family)